MIVKDDPSQTGAELSYLDLLAGLRDDVAGDALMPSKTRGRALDLVDELARLLVPHSA